MSKHYFHSITNAFCVNLYFVQIYIFALNQLHLFVALSWDVYISLKPVFLAPLPVQGSDVMPYKWALAHSDSI